MCYMMEGPEMEKVTAMERMNRSADVVSPLRVEPSVTPCIYERADRLA